MKIPKNYSIYESSYGSEFPVEQLYVSNFNVIPSRYSDLSEYSNEIFKYFIEQGFEIIGESTHKLTRLERKKITYQKLLVHKKKNIVVRTSNPGDSNKVINILFYYNNANGNINSQINFDEINKYVVEKNKQNISLIKTQMGHLDIEDFELKIPKIDLKLNYGEEFLKIHNSILKTLNDPNGKGIVLLHGEPGTGKTTYIKYLTGLIKNKEIIFVPPSMAESLSDPNIVPFLMEYRNSILIIEDAEKVISDRRTNGSSAGVSNILNITDGILGDCLNIQIIATFNMNKEKIDTALLRKGRLIAEHRFDKLNIDNSNKLLKYLKKSYVTNESMSLADIYNVDVELLKSEDNSGKIGFYANSK
jgi:energy-coupling factor transporter ATP-binding protein EcfA2